MAALLLLFVIVFNPCKTLQMFYFRTWNLVKGRPAYTTNLHAQGEDVAFSESGDLYAVLKLLKGGAKFAVDVYGIQVAGVVYSLVPESRPSCVIFLEVI